MGFLLLSAGGESQGMIGFLVQHYTEGGWGMHPILILGAVTLWITIERTKFLFTCRVEHRSFQALMRKLLMQGNVAGAIMACRESNQPLPRLVEAGLRRLGSQDSTVQDAVDEAAMRELPRIEKRTGYLAMLGNVATLMGLLGTISGLITSFAAVGIGAGQEGAASVNATTQAELLASGISEAMNCTAFGLGVGILALLAFAVLNGRTQLLLDEINESTVSVLNLATGHRNAMNLDGIRQV